MANVVMGQTTTVTAEPTARIQTAPQPECQNGNGNGNGGNGGATDYDGDGYDETVDCNDYNPMFIQELWTIQMMAWTRTAMGKMRPTEMVAMAATVATAVTVVMAVADKASCAPTPVREFLFLPRPTMASAKTVVLVT